MRLDALARIAKHAALDDAEALRDSLGTLDGEPVSIARALRRHHLLRMIETTLSPEALASTLAADLRHAIAAERPIQQVSTGVLLGAFVEIRDRLENAGVPVILLKGLTFAERLYGGLERRPQFDLDLLVRRGDARRAGRHLREAGFVRGDYDLHSTTLLRDGVKVDVHRCLRWAPAFRLDEDAPWRAATLARIGGVEARTLDDDANLVLLVLSAFEDLGQGSAKLKQLLDLALLARELDATFDWRAFFARRAAENLAGIAATMLALVLALFELERDVPRLAGTLAERAPEPALADRATALRLLEAPRKSPQAFAWFARLYPGSIALYLAWFWLGGFPANASGALPALRAALAGAPVRRARMRTSTSRGKAASGWAPEEPTNRLEPPESLNVDHGRVGRSVEGNRDATVGGAARADHHVASDEEP